MSLADFIMNYLGGGEKIFRGDTKILSDFWGEYNIFPSTYVYMILHNKIYRVLTLIYTRLNFLSSYAVIAKKTSVNQVLQKVCYFYDYLGLTNKILHDSFIRLVLLVLYLFPRELPFARVSRNFY